jgi:hypothetical protein
VGTLCTLLTEKKNADISMEMYDSPVPAQTHRRTEGPDRPGRTRHPTSRALKDHIMVNPEFVDDEFHDDMPAIAG